MPCALLLCTTFALAHVLGGPYMAVARSTAAADARSCNADAGEACSAGDAPQDTAAAPGCAPYERSIGAGDDALRVCPIMNGLWTSFLDSRAWGSYEASLDGSGDGDGFGHAVSVRAMDPGRADPRAAAMLDEMAAYEAAGLTTWIGEDFDERVMSMLRLNARRPGGGRNGVVSIIVEKPSNVVAGVKSLCAQLGVDALDWVQLGPPALNHLDAYARLRREGFVRHYGVEDFDARMIRRMHTAFPVETVQQELNLIVRPARATLKLCERIGCKFVGYGSLLGGLLSDRYLGVKRAPVPDAEHSKMRDYLASIAEWGGTGGWREFQKLLRVLRRVADRHANAGAGAGANAGAGATIAQVALAYTLGLDNVLGAIVGIRLGRAEHRAESLGALRLALTEEDRREIRVAVISGGIVKDGLART